MQHMVPSLSTRGRGGRSAYLCVTKLGENKIVFCCLLTKQYIISHFLPCDRNA